jgi:hypothetical protein
VLRATLFGDVFRAVNPWLALARATGWVARPADGGTLIAAAISIAGRLPQART